MDREMILNKLESLRRCVRRIRDKTPVDAQTLLEDYDTQDIISINLERAVQMCVDIASHIIADSKESPPTTMATGFDSLHKLGAISAELALRLKKAVGFRNISVHAYQEINWEIVFAIITTRLDVFSDFAAAIDTMLKAGGEKNPRTT